MNGVESARAVVADEHRRAPAITFGENLRAAAASALSIEQANLVVAQVAASRLFAWSENFASVLFALGAIGGDIVLRQIEVLEGKLRGHVEMAGVIEAFPDVSRQLRSLVHVFVLKQAL